MKWRGRWWDMCHVYLYTKPWSQETRDEPHLHEQWISTKQQQQQQHSDNTNKLGGSLSGHVRSQLSSWTKTIGGTIKKIIGVCVCVCLKFLWLARGHVMASDVMSAKMNDRHDQTEGHMTKQKVTWPNGRSHDQTEGHMTKRKVTWPNGRSHDQTEGHMTKRKVTWHETFRPKPSGFEEGGNRTTRSQASQESEMANSIVAPSQMSQTWGDRHDDTAALEQQHIAAQRKSRHRHGERQSRTEEGSVSVEEAASWEQTQRAGSLRRTRAWLLPALPGATGGRGGARPFTGAPLATGAHFVVAHEYAVFLAALEVADCLDGAVVLPCREGRQSQTLGATPSHWCHNLKKYWLWKMC